MDGRITHAEGNYTTRGFGAHAEGNLTVASGTSAHAEGYQTVCKGTPSICEGQPSWTGSPEDVMRWAREYEKRKQNRHQRTAAPRAPSSGVSIDPSADAAYAKFNAKPIARTVELRNGLILDLADDGSIVGIEVLGYSSPWDDDPPDSAVPAYR